MSLLSKYYDMQLIGDLPLSALGGLLSYAEEQELLPLWIANFAVSKVSNKSSISFEDFISEVFGRGKSTPQASKSSPEDIEAELMEIANRERKKHRKEE